MKYPVLQTVPWGEGPEGLHRRFPRGHHSFCLHSSGLDRYSYVGADPVGTLKIYPRSFSWTAEGKAQAFSDNPYQWLQKMGPAGLPSTFPQFASGWLGFFSYETAPFADSALPGRELPTDTLIGFLGLYDPIFAFDHAEKKACVLSWGLQPDFRSDEGLARERIEGALTLMKRGNGVLPPFEAAVDGLFRKAESNFPRDHYLGAIRRVLEYLAAGDCYQVNLSQQFQIVSEKELDAASLFWQLVRRHPAPFSAAVDTGDLQILSLSPEEFFSIRGDEIVTRPIKGTRGRFRDPVRDAAALEELRGSAKDQAELLMIVDLERNDLGKICRPGTVEVADFKRVESFDYVHHLTATVKGRLQEGVHPIGALKALFPGGSVTGAPKRRAMEILRELEPGPRGVYTGALGFIDASGFTRFNIPIRTLEIQGQTARFGMGGGIVADSDPVSEWEETLAKAKVFLD